MATLAERAKTQATVLLGFVTAIWVIELADQLLFRRSLDRLGIRPRDLESIWGIAIAPFLHGGLGHLIANTAPLIALGWLVLLRGVGTFLTVSIFVVLLGGFGVWLFGPPNTIHIGASGLIFGLLGYLLARGFFERRLSSILLSVLVGLLYGGALWGLLPGQRGISWQGHLFGFLAGVLVAWLLASSSRRAGSGRRLIA